MREGRWGNMEWFKVCKVQLKKTKLKLPLLLERQRLTFLRLVTPSQPNHLRYRFLDLIGF